MGFSGLAVCGRDRAFGVFIFVSVQVNSRKSLIFVCMRPISRLFLILMIAIAAMMSSYESTAQCPMCKMSAESNLKNGGSAGRGLNAGILYMLALPYTLVGTIGFIWWRKNRRKEEDEVEVLP